MVGAVARDDATHGTGTRLPFLSRRYSCRFGVARRPVVGPPGRAAGSSVRAGAAPTCALAAVGAKRGVRRGEALAVADVGVVHRAQDAAHDLKALTPRFEPVGVFGQHADRRRRGPDRRAARASPASRGRRAAPCRAWPQRPRPDCAGRGASAPHISSARPQLAPGSFASVLTSGSYSREQVLHFPDGDRGLPPSSGLPRGSGAACPARPPSSNSTRPQARDFSRSQTTRPSPSPFCASGALRSSASRAPTPRAPCASDTSVRWWAI